MPNLQYYRNKKEIKKVEPGSLWIKENGLFILVDDDEFISVKVINHETDFFSVPDKHTL